jgi:hypothetical protein
MRGPPDAERRPAWEPDDATDCLDATSKSSKASEPVAQGEVRCADGRPCSEVVDRLVAADRSFAQGFDDEANRLRASAERWANAHGHGGESRDSIEESA